MLVDQLIIPLVLSGISIYNSSLFSAFWLACISIEKTVHDFLWKGVEEGKTCAFCLMEDH